MSKWSITRLARRIKKLVPQIKDGPMNPMKDWGHKTLWFDILWPIPEEKKKESLIRIFDTWTTELEGKMTPLPN